MQEYTSRRYRWIYNEVTPKERVCAAELARDGKLPVSLAQVLVKRGITTLSRLDEYFKTPLNSLINPFAMKDMQKAVDRIIHAMKKDELICIYGDYDVDGVTATSLLCLFFKELGARVLHYIPNRLEEGYGLNAEAIEELARKKVNLLITVDCGISAIEEVKVAANIGLDVIITDHHQAGDELPAALAVVSPMRADDTYSFKSLSGVGVAFKLCMAVRHALRGDSKWVKQLPNLKQYLDIVALGTIADVVPLQGENRTFVIHGLQMLTSPNARPGLDELKKISGINARNSLTSYHVGFNLAPRINAVGRLGNSDRGFKLLTTADRNEARRLAQELDQENKFRQNIERDILKEVFGKIDAEKLADKHSGLVLHSANWHPGVLGIVASRVVDRYHRPTIVMTEENGVYKGSARSISSFHLYNGLKELSDMLISFGGHKYAAGLKIEKQRIDELSERFDALVHSSLQEKDYIPELYIDAFIEPKEITENFMQILESFEPYGNSNKEPIFCMRDVLLYQKVSFVGRDSSHAKCYFEKNGVIFEAIGYDMKIYEPIFNTNSRFDVLFSLSYNNYGRSHTLQMVLKDVREFK
jgi:single-stranded-DNA-specific exonuclease